MTTFTVTTAADIVDSGDERLSLREAVASANANAEQDTIVFADGLGPVFLTSGALLIDGGPTLTIDGDRDNDGVADVAISANGLSHHFTVDSRSGLVLDGLNLVDGHGSGAAGRTGIFAPSTVNSGDLTVIHTTISESSAEGGQGGTGASGFPGVPGGHGGNENGGSGLNGDSGAAGGAAAASILNQAEGRLTIIDSALVDNQATGGSGGRGGSGGAGGDGQDLTGSGGDGGAAGAPGASGAAGEIVNYGTVSISSGATIGGAQASTAVAAGASSGGRAALASSTARMATTARNLRPEPPGRRASSSTRARARWKAPGSPRACSSSAARTWTRPSRGRDRLHV